MFATVEFYERERDALSFIKDIFKKPKIISEKVFLPENEYFYKLKVPVTKGVIPYDRLKKFSSGIVSGLIFPEGFVPKENLKVYSSKYFRDLLLFNTALEWIKNSAVDPLGRVITVIDPKAVLSSGVKELVPYAGEIRVITDNCRPYEMLSEKIMDEYGLSLFVTNKLSMIPKDGIIISSQSGTVPLSFKGVVITCERRFLPFAGVLTGEGVTAEKRYVDLCPEKINTEDFLSALCEVCFVKDLRSARYEKLVDIS